MGVKVSLSRALAIRLSVKVTSSHEKVLAKTSAWDTATTSRVSFWELSGVESCPLFGVLEARGNAGPGSHDARPWPVGGCKAGPRVVGRLINIEMTEGLDTVNWCG